MVLFNFINYRICIMDRGDTFSKSLAEKQKNIQAIQQKLLEPECAHIDQMLAKTEYQSIRDTLLDQPNLFLLLLNNPTALSLCLTQNTREGFLKDLKENPDQIKALVMQNQATEQSPPQILQESTDSNASKEIDLLQDAKEVLNEVYGQVANFAAVYTPSLNNVTDTFSSFVEGLTCALPSIDAHVDDVQADTTVQDGTKQKKLTSTSK